MKSEHRIELGEDPQRVAHLLEDRLYEHNSGKVDRHDGSLFSRIVRDDGGAVVAGVAGWTWAGACEITQLWIEESLRSRGIGKRLLEAAEEEARSKKCSTILVRTYSFQAPAFYEKHGYEIVHVVKGFPRGHSYFTLTKRLEV